MMKTRTLAFAVMLGGLAAAPAFAAENTTTTTAPANAANATFISQAQAGDWRASKLVGVDIYGPDNKSIGDVNDVLINRDGSIKAVVIGVGGFLGVGEKSVALPFSAIQWMDAPATNAASNTATAPATTGTVPAAGTAPSASTGAAPATAPAAPATTAAAAPTVNDYPDHGVLNMTKDQLQNAPTFSYASERK